MDVHVMIYALVQNGKHVAVEKGDISVVTAISSYLKHCFFNTRKCISIKQVRLGVQKG